MTRTSAMLAIYLLLLCCTLPLMAQTTASAGSVVPGMVRFAGSLSDGNSKPLAGTVGVTFLLYKEQSGGTPLWMETQNVQADKNGHYSVLLGSAGSQGIPAQAFTAGEARWIAVQVSGQAEQPRVELVSVPYALKAADAQTLGGFPPSAFLLAPAIGTTPTGVSGTTTRLQTQDAGTIPVTTAGGTAKALAKFDANADIASSQIFDTGTNVGIGVSSPKGKLDVNGSSVFRGVLTLPATGTATATAGRNSQPQNLTASAFNSSSSTAVPQTFQWQAEPAGNNTGTASASLNLLFGRGSSSPAETGLNIASNGQITFAPGQTFPGTGTGNGSVTSVGLSAPASDFSVSGSPVTGSGTLSLQWLIAPTVDNVPNAIVKRDSFGNIATGALFATGLVQAGSFVLSRNVTALTDDTGNFVVAVDGEVNSIGNAGATKGVVGKSGSDNGTGVQGQTTGLNGVGVQGNTFGTSGLAKGVFGSAHGPGTGVFGDNDSPSGIGVAAVNDFGGDALYTEAINGGFAAFFVGDVDVDGRLSKAAGSFKIDHPLDPANQYLYHSFVESPDMMNVYNGNITTDSQGKAVVQMPDWFEALNRDFRYQLTVIGQFAQAIVASEMANHAFTIRTDKPNVKVSWQVTGIRHDAYADAHRIPVEEAKPDKERGLYLHPELFGASREKSIAAARHPAVMNMAKEGKNNLNDSSRQ